MVFVDRILNISEPNPLICSHFYTVKLKSCLNTMTDGTIFVSSHSLLVQLQFSAKMSDMQGYGHVPLSRNVFSDS